MTHPRRAFPWWKRDGMITFYAVVISLALGTGLGFLVIKVFMQ